MSSFIIKLIAIITMICDHSSDAIVGHLTFFNIIGRIAFPLFCFQLVIGYKHTTNIKKYLIRLIIFGLLSQVPFSIFIYSFTGTFDTLNIFFTLFLGLIAILTLDKLPNKWLAIIIDALIILIADFIKVDYGWFGVCLILCIFVFYNDKHNKKENANNFLDIFRNNILFTIAFFLLCFTKYCIHFAIANAYIVWAEILGTFFPIIFMLLYNGKKGPSFKYFFYAFYPIHLLLLTLIHYALQM